MILKQNMTYWRCFLHITNYKYFTVVMTRYKVSFTTIIMNNSIDLAEEYSAINLINKPFKNGKKDLGIKNCHLSKTLEQNKVGAFAKQGWAGIGIGMHRSKRT